MGISVDGIVTVDSDSEGFKLVLEEFDRRLVIVSCDHDASDIKPVFLKDLNQAQHIPVIGYA